jgi:hypothetical protein
MNPTDELDIFTAQNSGGAETEYVFVSLSDGLVHPAPAGRFFTVHGTGSTTVTPSAFSLRNYSTRPSRLDSTPWSRAHIRRHGEGFQTRSAMEPLWRPGGTALATYDALDPPAARIFYDGQVVAPWGVWMSFYQNVPPQLDMFCQAQIPRRNFGWT